MATRENRHPDFSYRRCPECDRVFDMFDEVDQAEYMYGHDCEA